ASLTDGCLGAAHGYSAAARRTSFPRIGLTAAQLAGLGGRLKAQKRALRASSCNKACAIDENWRGGRVAEGARLESVYTGNRIEGSNPSLSASPVCCSIFRQPGLTSKPMHQRGP